MPRSEKQTAGVLGRGQERHGEIAWRVTNSYGFCFSDISSGKCEVRVSQTGFDNVSMMVSVNRKIEKIDNLEVALPLSD
jgi:hypothetical protein